MGHKPLYKVMNKTPKEKKGGEKTKQTCLMSENLSSINLLWPYYLFYL